MRKQDLHVFNGMQRDLDVAKHRPESLYDAKNLRFTARNGDNLLSVTNEKGTTQITDVALVGEYLGHCVINDYVVVFTHGDTYDYIYKVTPTTDSSATVFELYHGELGFSNLIETLGVYENENVQKVYWVDGENQPRVLNVCRLEDNSELRTRHETQFDFVPTLQLNESISVARAEGSGMFAPGTIQYAFSYYNLYGQQSNIFYSTRLYYISFIDRGGSPEDKIANTFKITINNVDTEFDFLRIYSIHRTSLDAVPTVKRVADLDINLVTANKLTFVDDGTMGDTVDPTELLYLGGESIVANTIASKDNALFIGNYKITRHEAFELKDSLFPNKVTPSTSITTQSIHDYTRSAYYTYGSSLKECYPGFKQREHYRLGVQFQHNSGRWTTPLWLTDYTVNTKNTDAHVQDAIWLHPDCYIDNDVMKLDTVTLDVLLPNIKAQAEALGFVKVRPVCVFPDIKDRLVLTQGLLCPTVFNTEARRTQSPFVQSSWFIRPFLPKEASLEDNSGENAELGAWIEFRHNHKLTSSDNRGAEIAGSLGGNDWIQKQSYNSSVFGVDQSTLTMHSPEIEFDDSFDNLDLSTWKLRLVGISNFTSNIGQIDITTSTPAATGNGFIKKSIGVSALKDDTTQAYRSLVSGLFWQDGKLHIEPGGESSVDVYEMLGTFSYMVYPWHGIGALNSDISRPEGYGATTALLKSKIISNLKVSDFNSWIKDGANNTVFDITKINLFSSDQVVLTKLQYPDTNVDLKNINYYGNVDTIINGDTYGGYLSNGIDFKSDTLEAYLSKANAIRMSYKSGRHLVFSLKAATTHSPIILPSINNLNRSRVDYNIPYWLENSLLDSKESYFTPDEYILIDENHKCGGPTLANAQSKFIANVPTLDIPRGQGGYWYVYDENDLMSSNGSNVIYYVSDELVYDVGNYDHYNNIWKVNDVVKTADVVFKIHFNDGTQDFYVKTKGNDAGEVVTTAAPTFDPGDGEINFGVSQGNIALTDIISTKGQEVEDDTTAFDLQYGYLFLGELYRDADANIDFGGNTEEAIRANLWLPAGEPQDIETTTVLHYIYGDTWYQRYDFLKTYPFAEEKENSIVEIGSFMCETRVNVDGRYDKNRGLIDNLNTRPTNFNKMNNVYSQRNNFFNYRILEDRFYELDTFKNQILWSLEKLPAQEVDSWTNVSLASTFDLDGNFGDLNALRYFNDNLYYFQDKSFGQLLYNSRVQINPSDGVPIEIANNKKLEAKRAISDTIGCKNKWSICSTPSGLYFIDSNGKRLYSFSDKLSAVSDVLGMDNWFKSKYNMEEEKTFYDSKHQDIYLVWNDDCLVLNTSLGKFTSFMDYNNTPAMFNIDSNFYALRNNNQVDMYSMFTGEYNYFFDTYKPYWLEFISNDNSIFDKIFGTVETRVDFFPIASDGPGEFFDTIRVATEYQDTGTVELAPLSKKKFRIWRTEIPRDKDRTLDRIRNTWARFRFEKNTNLENRKMELHDMNVHYFV